MNRMGCPICSDDAEGGGEMNGRVRAAQEGGDGQKTGDEIVHGSWERSRAGT